MIRYQWLRVTRVSLTRFQFISPPPLTGPKSLPPSERAPLMAALELLDRYVTVFAAVRSARRLELSPSPWLVARGVEQPLSRSQPRSHSHGAREIPPLSISHTDTLSLSLSLSF